MRDLLFIATVVAFFALGRAPGHGLRADTRAHRRRERRTMSWENAVGLIVSVAVLVYLVYALLFPERLG